MSKIEPKQNKIRKYQVIRFITSILYEKLASKVSDQYYQTNYEIQHTLPRSNLCVDGRHYLSTSLWSDVQLQMLHWQWL